MQERLIDINPRAQIKAKKAFTPDNINELLMGQYDYIVDAIDNVTGKLAIIEYAVNNNIPVISSMGAANKLSNRNFQVVDISETRVCPLAKVMRRELRNRGISKGVKVVYSPTSLLNPIKSTWKIPLANGNSGSIPYSSVAGLIIAGEVISDLLNL